MKKFFLFALLCAGFLATNSLFATNAVADRQAQMEQLAAKFNDLPTEASTMTAEEFLALTPAKYKELTGEKMNLKQVVALKAAQKMAKKQLGAEGGAGGKSQLVALLLAIFLGYLGIHRFYLGYMGIGVIQLLTLGGCGIWALIDCIMIAIGSLKPKDGDYGTTL